MICLEWVTPVTPAIPLAPHSEKRTMGQLLQTYLPLVIFIGIAFIISAAIFIAPFIIAVSKPDPRRSRPMNAASTPSTTRA